MAREKAPLPTAAPADDKKKAIDTAMAQIEKMYGKGSIMRLGDRAELNVDYIPTGSLALDVALGIGVNVLQRPEDFGPEVREMATSLAQALGRPVSRPALAAELIRETDRLYAALRSGALEPYLAEYRRRCVNLGRTVRLLSPGGAAGETAEALDIDGDFGLVVRAADGRVRTVRSGEVSVRGMYGYTE